MNLEALVTFSQPGYYRVVVRVDATPPASEEQPPVRSLRDTVVRNENWTTLWIVVDESSGRLTNGFEEGVAGPERIPAYGSYGPFLRAPWADGGGANGINGAQSDANAAAQTDGFYQGYGYVYYRNHDEPSLPPQPVPYAAVAGWCINNLMDRSGYFAGAIADANGYFVLNCPYGAYWFEGQTMLYRAGIVNALGPNGALAGALVTYVNNFSTQTIYVANDAAARVYDRLGQYVPIAFQRFGRSRPLVVAYVADNDANYGIFYQSANDRILTNYTRVFGSDGTFVTLHEYGHAFHWVGIEPPDDYSCTDNQHAWRETENLSCAFVEGFADFFGMWVPGDRLVNDPYGGDWGLEHNRADAAGTLVTNPPPGGDGVRVESAVAAFLYDLVDGANEPDSPSNTADGDESFDAAVYQASWIANTMQHCRLDGLTRLDGADQLVYCLERSSSPSGAWNESRRWSTAWRSYGTVSFGTPVAAPTGFSAEVVRKLWKYNMYGVLEEPLPPPPPSHSATILGPTSINPSALACYWYASTSVGDPQFSWRVNGNEVGNEQTLYYHTFSWQAQASFTLELAVWNGQGHGAGDSKYIDVSTWNPPCDDY